MEMVILSKEDLIKCPCDFELMITMNWTDSKGDSQINKLNILIG